MHIAQTERSEAHHRVKALVADGQELFRRALKRMLTGDLDVEAVGEAATLNEVLQRLAEEHHDVLLVDPALPGLHNNIEAISAICEHYADTKVVLVAASAHQADILRALAAGARGYIPKSLPAAQVAAALRHVVEGSIYVPLAVGSRPARTAPPSMLGRSNIDILTSRQKLVMAELSKGQATKEIARTLKLAEGTVKSHLSAIYRVLGVRTRAEAIAKLRFKG